MTIELTLNASDMQRAAEEVILEMRQTGAVDTFLTADDETRAAIVAKMLNVRLAKLDQFVTAYQTDANARRGFQMLVLGVCHD